MPSIPPHRVCFVLEEFVRLLRTSTAAAALHVSLPLPSLLPNRVCFVLEEFVATLSLSSVPFV
jgi:hypothetical protein